MIALRNIKVHYLPDRSNSRTCRYCGTPLGYSSESADGMSFWMCPCCGYAEESSEARVSAHIIMKDPFDV